MSRYVHCKTCDRPMENIIVDDDDTLLIWDGHPVGTKVAMCVRRGCEDIGNTIPVHRYEHQSARL